MTEQAIQFQSTQGGTSQTLVGILSPAAGTTGLLIVVGGPQYRIGSHRQFVKMCRAAAANQIPAFRFDVAGMGDSTGEPAPFYQQAADIHAAINQFFVLQPQLTSVVLWGLCDGASAILLALRHKADPRVSGLVLLNPWVRQQHSYAQTLVKHYYLQRFMQKEFWQKLFSGKFDLVGSCKALFDNLRQSKQQQAQESGLSQTTEQNYVSHMRQSWQQFYQSGGKVLVITSGNDLTAKEFLDLTAADSQWQQLLQQADHQPIDEANHTFSTALWREQVEQMTITAIQRQ
jgi:exosortase A-associated hydrolase 1